jgi:nucleotide-binding universal stress UspA family protein
MKDNGRMLPPKTILTTTDFSDASRPGLLAAAQLAAATGAALHVVHAEEPLLTAAAQHSNVDITTPTREELQKFVAAALPARAPSPQLHVRSGSAVDAILAAAAALGADMIVIASHGRTGVRRAVFGSVAEGVLRAAAAPVLVIPAKH